MATLAPRGAGWLYLSGCYSLGIRSSRDEAGATGPENGGASGGKPDPAAFVTIVILAVVNP